MMCCGDIISSFGKVIIFSFMLDPQSEIYINVLYYFTFLSI